MAREIERKFLVRDETWLQGVDGTYCCQGYLSSSATVTVRVRILGERGFLTVKGRTEGCARDEFDYEIPKPDAEAMLATLTDGSLIEKIRYRVPFAGLVWEVDVFLGDNAGLVLAEVELSDEGQQVLLPAWVGQEVTGDTRYYNALLARHPYRSWS